LKNAILRRHSCRKCREAPCGSPRQKHIKINITVLETHKGPPYITLIRKAKEKTKFREIRNEFT